MKLKTGNRSRPAEVKDANSHNIVHWFTVVASEKKIGQSVKEG